MSSLTRWFLFLVVIGPIHILEQVWFGLDELQELKAMMASYYGKFADSDIATVTMVVIVVSIVQVLLLAAFAGGRWRLLAAGFFGVFAVGEVHHLLRTIVSGRYNPGLVTMIPFVAIGVMILIAVAREWRSEAQVQQAQVAAA